jgi:hypothetical protein
MNGERLDRAIKKWTEISEGQPRLDPCAVVRIPPIRRLPARPLCHSRFVPTVAALCSALSRTAQGHSKD